MGSRYLHLKVAEVEGKIIQSSISRMEAISKHPSVKCRQDVIDILSDQTSKDYRVYRDFSSDDVEIQTIATGMPTSESRIFMFFSFYFPSALKLVVDVWSY